MELTIDQQMSESVENALQLRTAGEEEKKEGSAVEMMLDDFSLGAIGSGQTFSGRTLKRGDLVPQPAAMENEMEVEGAEGGGYEQENSDRKPAGREDEAVPGMDPPHLPSSRQTGAAQPLPL